jgi:murein DD-endopeptidase MepM/ murein hydrolase activator NlpD
MRSMPLIAALAAAGVLMLACGSADTPSAPSAAADGDQCGPFPDWQTSSYVLPYSVGASFVVNQANCSGFGHSGFWKHGYDFTMAIGTDVRAARRGKVLHSQGDATDGDRQRTNLVTIMHDDGTVALYSHLTTNGNLVAAGDHVEAGALIGLSGDTGNTGGLPHLHVSLHPCGDLPGPRQERPIRPRLPLPTAFPTR